MPYLPASRTEVSTACEMSVSRPPTRAAARPAHIEASHACDSATASGETSPTNTVIAESPCQPSTIAPKSIEMVSPSVSFSPTVGIPCTTRSFTEAQMTAG